MGDALSINQLRSAVLAGIADVTSFGTGLVTFAAAAVTIGSTIPIGTNGDFVLCYIMGWTSRYLANVQPDLEMLIKVTDTATGMPLMDRAEHSNVWIGTSQQPLELPAQHRFSRGGSIAWELTNLSPVPGMLARVGFLGYRIT